MSTEVRQITVPQFTAMKASGRKITVLTAYDYPTAKLVDSTDIECILVGDSLSMVVQGNANTLPVTLDEMIYHATMVVPGGPPRAGGGRHAVSNLPPRHVQAIDDAARILKESHCQAVKLEGGTDQAEVIEAFVSAGIPVMSHCGLRPQSVHRMGGYRVQRDTAELMADAKAAQQAGAFAIVLECIPAEIAHEITAELAIPTIGIGAGPHCDGQVQVLHDMLGITLGHVPRHAKAYADLKNTIAEAVTRYRDEVREGVFPGDEQSFV